MKLTRRKCLFLGAGFVFLAISPVYGGMQEEELWRTLCRKWMHVLVPTDEHGPGADTPDVWLRLEAHMDSDPAVKRSMLMGFRALAEIAVPDDNGGQLNALLGGGAPVASSVKWLRYELIENYYGTECGWRDLGFKTPPLP
jgi:hypothetical protein